MNEFVTVPPTVNNSELLNRIDLPEDPASQQTEEIRKTIDKPLYEEDKKKKCVDSILQKIIQSNGSIRSNELSDQFAYSEQYLNRIFKNQTGLTPKSYSNLVRFQNALTLLLNNPQMIDLSELSIQSGYYDQSHMIKEFKKYTNQTPQAFLKTLKNA